VRERRTVETTRSVTVTTYRSHDRLGRTAGSSVDAARVPSSWSPTVTNPGQRELLLPERPVT
jgi:hypothetical protein